MKWIKIVYDYFFFNKNIHFNLCQIICLRSSLVSIIIIMQLELVPKESIICYTYVLSNGLYYVPVTGGLGDTV